MTEFVHNTKIFYGVEDWCPKDKKMIIKEYLYYTFKKICSLF